MYDLALFLYYLIKEIFRNLLKELGWYKAENVPPSILFLTSNLLLTSRKMNKNQTHASADVPMNRIPNQSAPQQFP